MNIIRAVHSLQRRKNQEEKNSLYTVWGEELKAQIEEAVRTSNYDELCPLDEYPRPQLKRSQYEILNGFWDYAIQKEKGIPEKFEGKILVPFSPECELSTVKRLLLPRENLWYRRFITIFEKPKEKRLLLHFGAVDQRATVYVNGYKAGKHTGGYLPFTFDITDMVEVGKNELMVRVTDDTDTCYHARGKQKLIHGGMFYTPQSGIWQTVWYEWVPEVYMEELRITPKYDKQAVAIKPVLKGIGEKATLDELPDMKIVISKRGKDILVYKGKAKGVVLSVKSAKGNMESWSPEHPILYELEVTIGDDTVESYFAMRKISIGKDRKGHPTILLNNRPYYQKGILDQGYWPEGLYTPPSDAAFLYDIVSMKELGYNMIRKHIKIEPLRWYYHCDRLGMLVWQDMVNGGDSYSLMRVCYLAGLAPHLGTKVKDNRYWYFSRKAKAGRKEWKNECIQTVKHLQNVPSIVMWVLFNEGWGQFDSAELYKIIKKIDKTRIVDHASGWFDQKTGDVKSEHNYFRRLKVKHDRRPFILSEFGGFVCHICGHSYSENTFGYRMFASRIEFTKAYHKLYEKKVEPLKKKGLCATVYTQLSDVEEEVNGLLTYDRKYKKLKKLEK
ncbi:MAG: glycoside hydrolase family 2 TIM barrel-domain containing protein [bacterium]|nr:glycoside hydrolase family 2 TIM barrel-domain containing protein [bacterium]